MKINGKIVTGALQGWEMIRKYHPRLTNILGFSPFEGTLDIKLERSVDIKEYATKTIEHILLHGKPHIEAYLAPVGLTIKKDGSKEGVWAIRRPESPFEKSLIEVLAKDNLRKKYDLKDRDEVEVTFFDKRHVRKKPVTRFVEKIIEKESRIAR